MTLQVLVQHIEEAVRGQVFVRTLVRNDIFRLNSIPDVDYGVFAWTQNTHQYNRQRGQMDFRFTFYYADRLTNDRRNEIEVQSNGIETIQNVLLYLQDHFDDEIDIVTDVAISTFNQRFVDECAGAFASVTISVPVESDCEFIMGGNDLKII